MSNYANNCLIDDSILERIIRKLQELHTKILDTVRTQILRSDIDNMSAIMAQGAGDVSYALDVSAEKIIEEFFKEWNIPGGVVVISEGIGVKTFPLHIDENSAKFRIIIDPIDGTREIMYDKRSAWILTGVSLNKGKETNLSTIEIALQTEIPPSKQSISSVVYAIKGKGVYEELWDIDRKLLIQKKRKLISSTSKTIENGYAVFVNFFPGTRSIISAIGETIIETQVGSIKDSQALVFDDQYISTGGQVYLLASGKYRLVVDLRSELKGYQLRKGIGLGLCCHPYDLSTYLTVTESGGIITDTKGQILSYPLDTSTNSGWIGYANEDLRRKIEPILLEQISRLRNGYFG